MLTLALLSGAGVLAVVATLMLAPVTAACVGVSCSLLFAALIPSHTPPREFSVVGLAFPMIALAVAWIRNRKALPSIGWPAGLISILAFETVAYLRDSSALAGVMAVGTLIEFSLLAVVLRQANSSLEGSRELLGWVARTAACLAVVEFVLASSEVFLGSYAMWPLTSGKDVISHRVNALAPWLVGRALGSTSHPIPLGLLCGICVLVCVIAGRGLRKPGYLATAVLGSLVILMSGTRSALAGCLVAGAIGAVLANRHRPQIILPVGLLGCALALIVDVPELLGLRGDLSSSESLNHRRSVLAAWNVMIDRPWNQFLFGSGYDSVGDLFRSGRIGTDRVVVFDEEFFRTFFVAGIFALFLLILVCIESMRHASNPGKLLIVFMFMGMLVFDVLTWKLTTVLFVLSLELFRMPRSTGELKWSSVGSVPYSESRVASSG